MTYQQQIQEITHESRETGYLMALVDMRNILLEFDKEGRGYFILNELDDRMQEMYKIRQVTIFAPPQ